MSGRRCSPRTARGRPPALVYGFPGTVLISISDIEREVRRHGFAVVRGLAGHGVGRSIHEPPEVPNCFDPRQQDVLTDGLVLTIEPMISAGSDRVVQDRDGWTIRTRDRSLSAHHEHTLVITPGRPIVLTAYAA